MRDRTAGSPSLTSADELLSAVRDALAAAWLRTGDYNAVAAILERALRAAEAAGDRTAEGAVIAQQGMLLALLPRRGGSACDR